MKLILSRKGFDSSSGGVPSPILPDGRIVSLPIPDERSTIQYKDLDHNDLSLGSMVSQLTRHKITPEQGVHLDPDLLPDTLERQSGWRPVFGQSRAAQAHLRNQGVSAGDLFIFFGLFRQVEEYNGVFNWDKGAAPLHVIWGWLQVESIVPIESVTAPEYRWAHYHPHCQHLQDKNNVLYLARDRLNINGVATELPGAGVFPRFDAKRQLTARDGSNVSLWELPRWCYPRRCCIPFSHHSDRARWQRQKHRTLLRSVARGQEFVLDAQQYPEALLWVQDMLCN